MKYTVDRIEGDFVVCEAEDQTMVNIPLCDLPEGTKEGDHLLSTDGTYEIIPADPERKQRIKDLMDDLWE